MERKRDRGMERQREGCRDKGKYGVWSMEYGVWSMEYGIGSKEYRTKLAFRTE